MLNINAVYEHFALLHVIVSWNEVEQSRLARARLSDERHCLSLLNLEVYVLQHPFLCISEADVAELYLMFERADILAFSLWQFCYIILCLQNLVYTLH